MKHNIRLRALMLALIITASLAAPGLAALDGVHWTWGSIKSSAEVTVAPGALYRTLDISSPIGPQKIHSIEFDPKNPMLALRAGMSGADVRTLQAALNANGYDCGSTDGIFGANTAAALKKFQTDWDLGADGIAGNGTWGKLLGV